MNNINFLIDAELVKVDNPWLFFIALGLIIVILVGFFLLPVEKRKKPKNIISLALHVVISITLATAFANISFLNSSKNVEVVVLADCSASESQSVEKMSSLINDVYSQAGNAKVGVVAYGRNQQVVNSLGSSFDQNKLKNMFDDSKNGDFDYTASDMAGALNYANTLFSDDAIKRIVLISDGIETDNSAIEVIDSLVSNQVSIDAIKLNENFKDEFGIIGLDYVNSSFVGREQQVKVSLRSIRSEKVKMTVTSSGEKLDSRDIELTSGLNVYTFKYIPKTAETREFQISFEVRGDGRDTYTENNSIHYSQTYVDKMNVLFIGEGNGDSYFFEQLNMYKNSDGSNSNAKIDTFTQTDEKCPYKLEDLLKYDEFVLSDVDITKMSHGQQFTTSLNTAVYTHGKSLLTFGSTNSNKISNTNSYLSQYNGMLPVQYDSTDQKALIFLIDNSGSMGNDQMNIAKNGTIKCLDLLSDNDYVGVVSFESSIKIVQPLTSVSNKDTITKNVRKIQSAGGTVMGPGLDQCRKMLADSSIEYKYVICLSDGLPSDTSACQTAVKKLANNNIMVNFINIANSSGESFLKGLAKKGNGTYKYVSSANKLTSAMEQLVVGEIDVEEIDQEDTPVEVKSEYSDDAILNDTNNSFPDINGFNYCRIKSTSKTILTVTYNKQGEDDDNVTYITVPLFAYWDYGKGMVSSFTSSIKNVDWTRTFLANNNVKTLMNNIGTQTLPYESSDHILTMESENLGTSSKITVSPNNGDVTGKITATVTKPDNSKEEINLVYDGNNYSINYPINTTGTYQLNIKYTGSVNGEEAKDEITRNLYFDFSKEFDFFTSDDTELLDKIAKRANGQYTIEKVNYVLNAEELASSSYFSSMMIFLLISVILFLIDVFVRKSDGLFKKKNVDTNSTISQ